MGNRLDRPPKVTFSFTRTCNLDCRLCYADCSENAAATELAREEWLALIDGMVRDGVIQVYIEGGEPLARPDFEDVLARAARDMMTLLRTNGTLIDRDRARRLRALGVGRVFVDLMGSVADTHEWFTRAPGSFERSKAAIRHLVDAGIPADVLIILTRRNAAEINDVLALAGELGAGRVGLLRLYPIGRAKRIWSEIALSLEEQTAVIAGLRPPPSVKLMQSWHPFDRNCCWQAATVDSVGNSIGCSYLREYVNFGNVRETTFLETWNDPLYRRLREGAVEHSCDGCAATQGSSGGCRSAAYAFHGRWDAPDPFCTTMNRGVDVRVLPEWLLAPNPRSPHEAAAGDGGVPSLQSGGAGHLLPEPTGVARVPALR